MGATTSPFGAACVLGLPARRRPTRSAACSSTWWHLAGRRQGRPADPHLGSPGRPAVNSRLQELTQNGFEQRRHALVTLEKVLDLLVVYGNLNGSSRQ